MMGEKEQKGLSIYAISKRVCHEVLIEGQIASSGAHQARLIEKFKKNTNYIKHQFLALKFVFAFLFAFLPIVPLFTYFELEGSFGLYSSNSISLISSFMFGIYFLMTFLYMLMFGMISTSSFMSGNSFKWLRTLPFSKKDIRKIGLMSLFRNIDIPLIVLIVGFPVTMLIGTQNIIIFFSSLFVSFLNVIFNFCLLVIIGEKLSFLFSESKGKSKKVNLVRIITMIGYFSIAFGSGIIFSVGIGFLETLFDSFIINEPPFILNIILSLIPFPFAPAYFVSLSTNPLQVSPELLLSTLIGLVLFILITWRLLRSAIRALKSTISAEIKIEKVEKKEIKVEVKPTSPIKAYIRKDLISSTRDIQSFMFIFFPIFYPLILIFTLQGPIIGEVTTIESIMVLWSIILGIYLFIPPMLIVGFLNIEESGSSTVASLPISPRDQAKAKIILMLSIQGISLVFTTIILTLLTNSILVLLLFLVSLPIGWSFLLLMFVLKIHLFGKMKYKYIIEELNKEHKISKWALMILIVFGSYMAILITSSLLFISFNITTTILALMIIGIISLSTLIFSFTRMFPKVEKMATYKTGGFLRDHVNVATVVLLLLYIVFMYLALPIVSIFLLLIGDISFLGLLFVHFIINFGILILLWLVVVPLGLKLPKKESFRDFSQTIGLISYKPLWRNLLLGIGILAIFGLSTSLFGIFLGTWIFDLSVLFGEPSISTGLGWFLLIFMLIPGIWEELAFRGVILNLQLKKYSQTTSIILNGVLFGLFHFVNLLFGANLYFTSIQVIYASFLGIAFSYMYVKTKSLLPSMIAHYLIDSVGQLFLIAFFPSIINLTIYLIVGIGIVPMILTITLVKITVRGRKYPKDLSLLTIF